VNEVTTLPPLHYLAREATGITTTQSETLGRQLLDVDWDFSGVLPNGGGLGIHGIHWYPAPFLPAVASSLIDILGTNCKSVLDPFSGSGVAPLEAWFSGKKAFGIDNNRFVVNISRAKSDLIAAASIKTAQSLVEEYKSVREKGLTLWEGLTPEGICEQAKIHPDAARWFTSKVLKEIGIAKTWIFRESKLAKPWRRALIVTLSSLLHKHFSMVRSYHYTYVVDRSKVAEQATDYVDVPKLFSDKIVANFTEGYLARQQLNRLNVSTDQVFRPRFLKGTAQKAAELVDQEVDLVITSPPYFGMNDYTRSQYLSWLVFQWKGYEQDISSESGSRRLRTNRKALNSYFTDMRQSFEAIYKVLRKDGYFALVVGRSNTLLAKEEDPVAKLESLIKEHGFSHRWSGTRRVRYRKINNIPYRTEVLWIFQK
jgi:hypothetical protein